MVKINKNLILNKDTLKLSNMTKIIGKSMKLSEVMQNLLKMIENCLNSLKMAKVNGSELGIKSLVLDIIIDFLN